MGHPALGDGTAVADRGRRVGAALVGVYSAGPADRLLERGAHGRVEDLERADDDVGGHLETRRCNPVEAFGRGVERGGTLLSHGGDDGPHGLQRGLYVVLGPRKCGPKLAKRQVTTAQVDPWDDAGGVGAGGARRHAASRASRPVGRPDAVHGDAPLTSRGRPLGRDDGLMAGPPAATKYFNKVALLVAGRRGPCPARAALRHRGRRSGKEYVVPIAVIPTDTTFLIALPWGRGTDWVRNVRAAGSCTIRWRGVDYACS